MTFKLNSRLAPAAALVLALSAYTVGCTVNTTVAPSTGATTSPTATEQEDPDAEGAEHLAEGPAKEVTAVAFEATGSVPVVDNDHHRYDIALVASGSQKVGKVKFDSDAAGDHIFYLNADVALAIKDAEGQAVAIEETGGPIASTSIKQHYVAELGVGSYFLHFGPTAEASLSLVIEAGAHDDER